MVTKTGMMLGLGETIQEVIEVMRDLRKIDCDILTLGQYLQPTAKHLAIERYLQPSEFEGLRKEGMGMLFRHVEADRLCEALTMPNGT
jgi:lipoic acid synthetase